MTQLKSPPNIALGKEHLANIGLFGGLDDVTLQLLADELPKHQAEVGQTVVREGDASNEMFIIISGELEVIKQSDGKADVRVALLGPNDWFGEMSILEPQPRSATVRAVAPTLLMRMNPEHVQTLLYRRDMKAYALFVMNIARELSRRLRVADGILAQFFTAVSQTYTTQAPPKR